MEQSNLLISAVEVLVTGVCLDFIRYKFVLEQKVKVSVLQETYHWQKLLWFKFSPECTSAYSLCLKVL